MHVPRVDVIRTPPHDVGAEQAVLGAIMLDHRAFVRVSDFIKEDDFYRKDHRLIWRAIDELIGKDVQPDAITLAEWFESNDLSEIVGGSSYILKVSNASPGPANIVGYADIVKEKSKLRQLIEVGTDITSAAFGGGAERMDSALIAARAANAVSLLVGDVRGGGPVTAAHIAAEWWEEMHERYENKIVMTGVPTPYTRLNELTLGFQPGELYILAARPSMGKTILVEEFMLHEGLREGGRSLLFALEMSRKAMYQRLVSSTSGVAHERLRNASTLSDDDWPRVTEAMQKVRKANILIDDRMSLSAAQIIATAKREHLRKPITLLGIDHGGLIKRPRKNDAAEIGQVTKDLKKLAKDLNIPVVLLWQLNRGLTDRHDKRPTLADLRASGEIEEDADVIMFLHREEYFTPKTYLDGYAEIIFGKGRNFAIDEKVWLISQLETMRFVDGVEPERPASPSRAGKKKGLSAPLADMMPD